MCALLWKLLDDYMEEMRDTGDDAATTKDVRLAELLTHSNPLDKLNIISVREVLECSLNTVYEQSVVIYHYIHDVFTAFQGDKLFFVDLSLSTQERIDAAVKRVQKMTPSARVAIAPIAAKQGKGTSGGGGGDGNKKSREGRPSGHHQQNGQQQPPSLPPGFGGRGGFAQGEKSGGTMGRGSCPSVTSVGCRDIASTCPKLGN